MIARINNESYFVKDYISAEPTILRIKGNSIFSINDISLFQQQDNNFNFIEAFPAEQYNFDFTVENEETVITITKQKDISQLIEEKVNQLSEDCTNTIYAGMDIELSDGVQHFTLDEHDQLNLSGIALELDSGSEYVAWHENDRKKPCQFYSIEDAKKIIKTLTIFKTYHITYFRDLRIYLDSIVDKEELKKIYYGAEIPDEYKSKVLKYYEELIKGDIT